MVQPVTPAAATYPSSPTKIGTSTSIGSEPDNAWVAARQSVITAGLDTLKRNSEKQHAGQGDGVDPDGQHDTQDQPSDTASEDATDPDEQEQHALSGESERIGTRNFDEDTPFGERVVIL